MKSIEISLDIFIVLSLDESPKIPKEMSHLVPDNGIFPLNHGSDYI